MKEERCKCCNKKSHLLFECKCKNFYCLKDLQQEKHKCPLLNISTQISKASFANKIVSQSLKVTKVPLI